MYLDSTHTSHLIVAIGFFEFSLCNILALSVMLFALTAIQFLLQSWLSAWYYKLQSGNLKQELTSA